MFRALLIVASALAMHVAAADVEKYSDKYDYVDADQILANDRLREQYYDCFIGNKPCVTPDSKFFGGIFTNAIVTKCIKCTDKQKVMFGKIVEWYTANQEDKWNAMLVKALADAKAAKSAAAS